ncbi:hypothetical protein E2C01_088262 [Portunus trituberculatus]|uniref:Uncharacterized protein n=1 Tax=Portunus trituberculatus TaxID=210409 RepID=A0A5B7J8R0_PORTR|nr:hypothetical protein [Portunus trituberculatus]
MQRGRKGLYRQRSNLDPQALTGRQEGLYVKGECPHAVARQRSAKKRRVL